MGSPSEPAVPAYRSLRLSRKHGQVLGADLNSSEILACVLRPQGWGASENFGRAEIATAVAAQPHPN
jgi:hypothetical protein